MSAVSSFFKVNDGDKSKADCKLCSAKLSRGGAKTGAFNTSNLIKHLSRVQGAFNASCGKQTQPTLQQTLEKREKMSRDNPRVVKITEALTHFIALDDQPLSVVDNMGFRRLLSVLELRYEIPSRHHITDAVLPKLHDFVKKHINSLLHDILAFSFTTDIWTSSVSPMSLISLTAQWIDEIFTLQRVVLHENRVHTPAKPSLLQTWSIPKSSVPIVLRDNANNMIRAMSDAELPRLLAQRSVADAVVVGWKIVGHFKHSALAYSRLEDIQVQLNQPIKRLQQDVQTRWNSTYYMLQSLIEQKRALGIFGSEHKLPDNLTAYQWALLEKTLTVLARFEELTRKVSSSSALASDVIPAVTVFLTLVTKETSRDTSPTQRKTHGTASQLYLIQEAKEMVMLELQKVSRGETDKQEDLGEPPARKLRQAQASSSLDSVFDEIADEQCTSGCFHSVRDIPWRDHSCQGRQPTVVLGVNKVRFPTLAQMSQRFLSASCNSVDSERLFSSISHIVDENRNRLAADNAQKLLFIKNNLPVTFSKQA